MLLLGIDDSGRGPLIGSMFLAGVLIKQENESSLKQEGVKDSKQLSHKNREKLAGLIKDICLDYYVTNASPKQIDYFVQSGINLNVLEAMKTAEIINNLTKEKNEKIKIIVDCPSTNIKSWKLILLNYIKNKNLDISCEHKADINHVVVSAASILAKCAREDSIQEIKQKYGDFGSGYTSDPLTKNFLEKYGKELENSGLFRKSWATWQNFLAEKEQKNLKDF